MKVIIDWVLAQRLRLVVVAIIAALLVQIVAAALLCVETARRGVNAGLLSAALGFAAVLLIGAAVARDDLAVFAVIGAISFGPGVVLGALVRRGGNLVFAFQAVVLLSIAIVAALTVFGPDPYELMQSTIKDIVEMLRTSGVAEEQLPIITERDGVLLFVGGVFSQLVGPLLLGYWWLTLAAGQRRFGAEFRALTLGRFVGALATVLIVLGLVLKSELVQNLTPLAWMGFLFQGLAVVHSLAFARRWHPALLAPLYVLMVLPPLSGIVGSALSAVGLVDNWFNVRARMRPKTDE